MRRLSHLRYAAGLFCAAFFALSTVHAQPQLLNITANVGGKFGMPDINNLGHVAMSWNNGGVSNFSGAPWFWNGSGDPVAISAGGVDNSGVGDIVLADTDRMVYFHSGGGSLRVVDPTGPVVTFDDGVQTANGSINNANTVVRRATTDGFYYQLYISSTPYDTSTGLFPSGTNYHLTMCDINNAGQIAYVYNSTIYLDDDGVAGNDATIGTSFMPAGQFTLSDRGQVLYRNSADRSALYLNGQRIYSGQLDRYYWYVYHALTETKKIGMSDDGKIVWCEWTGEPDANGYYNVGRWDIYTMIDGIPTNITAPLFDDAASAYHQNFYECWDPSINNSGDIVFAVTYQDSTAPTSGDIYLWSNDAPQPAIYNGHFNGNTLYGWNVVTQDTSNASLVERAPGDFAAQLTSGSPIELNQIVTNITAASDGTLSFDFDFGDSTGMLTVIFDGQTLAMLTEADDTEPGFTHYSIDGSVGPQPLLQFIFDSATPGSTVLLDNIVAVPEPATLALLALGALAMVHRRRR